MLKVSSKSSILLQKIPKHLEVHQKKKQTPLSIFIHIYYFLCLINDNLVTKLSYFPQREIEREGKLTASCEGDCFCERLLVKWEKEKKIQSICWGQAKLKGLSSFLSFFALTVFFMLYVQVLCLCYYYLLFFDHHITFNDWFSSWVFILLVSLLCFFVSLLMVYGFSSF